MSLFKRVGGLYHWRIGRVGGCFYVAKSQRRSVASSAAPRRADLAFARRLDAVIATHSAPPPVHWYR